MGVELNSDAFLHKERLPRTPVTASSLTSSPRSVEGNRSTGRVALKKSPVGSEHSVSPAVGGEGEPFVNQEGVTSRVMIGLKSPVQVSTAGRSAQGVKVVSAEARGEDRVSSLQVVT